MYNTARARDTKAACWAVPTRCSPAPRRRSAGLGASTLCPRWAPSRLQQRAGMHTSRAQTVAGGNALHAGRASAPHHGTRPTPVPPPPMLKSQRHPQLSSQGSSIPHTVRGNLSGGGRASTCSFHHHLQTCGPFPPTRMTPTPPNNTPNNRRLACQQFDQSAFSSAVGAEHRHTRPQATPRVDVHQLRLVLARVGVGGTRQLDDRLVLACRGGGVTATTGVKESREQGAEVSRVRPPLGHVAQVASPEHSSRSPLMPSRKPGSGNLNLVVAADSW